MVILSFGSGLNMEDDSPSNIEKYKLLADYAHSKRIKLGGYSLFSSRRIDDENDVIDPVTGLPDKELSSRVPACARIHGDWNICRKLKFYR